MEELLNTFRGKKVDVNCGASSMFQGEVLGLEHGVLRLEDEDKKVFYIAISRIVAVCEATDQGTRPGFIA